jgi:acetyltransferase
VLKADGPSLVHKSEQGGVILGIQDPKELAEAFARMSSRLHGDDVSFVVMEHKPPGREVILGAKASPGLGSLVMFGLGGVFVEVMRDVAVSVAPLTVFESQEMMKELKGYSVLQGVRGEAGVDLESLGEMLIRVSQLAADFPSILEMDLNPVLAYPAGTAPACVDVRIRIA